MADNGRHNENLKPTQLRAIRFLLSSKTAQDAAREAQIPERTLYRWLQDSDFRSALFAAESALIDAATRRLLRAQDAAIDVLEDLLQADSDSVRLRAAQTVLDHLLRLRELRDVKSRLDSITGELPIVALAPGMLDKLKPSAPSAIDYRNSLHLVAPDE